MRYYSTNCQDSRLSIKKKGPAQNGQVSFLCKSDNYSSTAACAAARRAMGTRKGEQDA